MKQGNKTWFSENTEARLTRKRVTADIRRIAASKAPLSDKMQEIRRLIEQYFNMESNEEFLNANL